MGGDPTKFGTITLQQAMDKALPDQLPDAAREFALGTMLSPLKVTFAALTSAAAQNITTAAALAAATIKGALNSNIPPLAALPPILSVTALRVTAGAATAGARVVTDAGGTAGAPGANGPGVALLSDDGTTLTFEGTVTGFVLEYIPRPAQDPSTAFLHS